MKSAYMVLGIPGNASLEDIEDAFERANSLYAARSTSDMSSAEKFSQVKTAYRVLRDPESRRAHDRKLAGDSIRPVARVQRVADTEIQRSFLQKSLPLLVLLVLIAVAGVFYLEAKKEAARKQEAAKELQIQKQAALEAEKQTALEAQEAAAKAQIERLAAQQERQFRQESSRAFANAQLAEARRSYEDAQRQSAEERAAQRKDYEARLLEQDAIRQSRQRLAMDKARIRELCYINYRRYDC